MRKYETGGYGEFIRPVEVVKETDKSIWVERDTGLKSPRTETRVMRKGGDYKWHGTWEDAQKYLIARQRELIEAIWKQMNMAEKRLGELSRLRPPNQEASDAAD